MKKLLIGFTLAEILITLTIIGVVARVTIPAVISNVKKTTAETALSKAVNTLETANNMTFVTTETASLTAAGLAAAITEKDDKGNETYKGDMKPDDYLNLIGAFANGTVQNSKVVINGGDPVSQTTLSTKDGMTFTPATGIELDEPYGIYKGHAIPETGNRIIPDKYDGDYVKLLVDINGTDGPNKLAKDQFVFYIDNFGAVIGYGSKEYVAYARTAKNANSTAPLWEAQCGLNAAPATTKNKAACTGSIIDNNYKIIYAY